MRRRFRPANAEPGGASILRLIGVVLAGAVAASAQITVSGYSGVTASLSPNGSYKIFVPDPGWQFSGSAGSEAIDSRIAVGADNLGAWRGLTFRYRIASASRSAAIRLYQNRPLVLFEVTYNNDSSNTLPFPAFTTFPERLSHLTYNGLFAAHSFEALSSDSPWIYFDREGNTVILSAASDYMIAATSIGDSGEIRTGISSMIPALPAGTTHQTVLAFGQGIQSTISRWGKALTDISGKRRPANDADVLLNDISYWTDNGSAYYYNPGGNSYPDTLLNMKAEFESKGIRLGSLQLDSWWYPKGPDDDWRTRGGIWLYAAAPGIFHRDLSAFSSALGLPIITHARWIDAMSPYRSVYTISGNVATDPRYWKDVAAYLHTSGVVGYEQDWLGEGAQTAFTLTDPRAFLNNMAAAMSSWGITMQYCMAEPKHFLQGTKYSNLTTIRVSRDRFNQDRWTNFLYTSQFAAAVGVWPFSDVIDSSERDNLLLATLSAGPVGVGDPVGSLSKANLLQSVRADGVIVKPDAPAIPDDNVLIADAQNIDTPMVATTYSDFGGLRATYIFAYPRAAARTITITPSTYGITGAAYLFDYLDRVGYRINAGSARTLNLKGVGYFVLAPVGPAGIAFIGDEGQFVTLGKKRIPVLKDDGNVDVTISFARGESVRTLFGYSPRPVTVSAISGRASTPVWDPATQLFRIEVRTLGRNDVRVRIAQERSRFAKQIRPRPRRNQEG